METRRIIIGILVVLFSISGAALGTTYYVATDGNDSNPGTIEEPFLTIQKAANIVNPGDTVLVREGTYYENGRLDIERYGTDANWITFQPYNNEEVIIAPSKTYTGWTDDGNDIYTRTFDGFQPNGGGLIRKDGYGISRVNTYEELLDPNIHPYGIAVLELFGMDANNVELYYFDSDTNEVSVKLAYGSPNDIYVITNWNRVEVGSVYKVGDTYFPVDAFVEINGFTIQYTHQGLKSYGNHTRIINNTLKHNYQSSIFVPYGDDTLITDNNVSYTGSPLRYITGTNQLIYNTLDHSVYVQGVDGVIVRNNIMEKCIGGHAMKLSGGYPTNGEIYNNYIEGGFFGNGRTQNKIYDNIILEELPFKQAIIIFDATGHEVYNNTIVATYPARLGHIGTLYNFTFKNNIVYSEGDYSLQLESVNFSTADINNNTYWGGDNFRIGKYPTWDVFSNFDDYQDYMVNTYSLEEQSFYADPCFVDDANDDFHLNIHSTCVNGGDPDGDYSGQVDIDGDARVIGSYVDIGADEVNVPVSDAHQWGLDELNGTIAYDSVGDSNGTFNGNDPYWADGLIGGAVDFNGVNDYFSVSSLDDEYSNSSAFTVAGWFKTESSAMQTILGQWSQYGGGAYYGWQVLVEDDKVTAKLGVDLTIIELSDTNDVNDGAWHQFAFVYPGSGGTSVLYVDGESVDTGYANFMLNDTKFRIGDGSYVCYYGTALEGGPFDGMIDEVMIFDSALSAGDVNDLYESGAPD